MAEQSSPAADAPPPDFILAQMLWSPLIQRSICVLTELGVPDLLATRSQTATELATKLGAHEPSLYRVLRTLSSAAVLSETADHRFELTPLSRLLCSDAPGSLRDIAIMLGSEWQWRNWGEFKHCLLTGEPAQEKVYGMGTFELFGQDDELAGVFNRAMTSMSAAVAPAIAEAYDFTRVGTVVELAGGHGLLLAAMLKKNPQMRGVLFDLPPVVAGAGELLEKEGVRDRVELVAGDFFQSVPQGHDLYTMKHIIHDWNDEQSIRILKSVRSAMGADARVLTIEMVVPEGNEPHPSKILDLEMLVMEGGKERTAIEYKALYEAAGLELTRIIPTHSPFSLVEGRPS